jgi:3-oxoadipate enol-lactonase
VEAIIKQVCATEALIAPRSKGKLNFQRFIIPYRVYGAGKTSLVFINGVQQSMAMWHSFVVRFSQRYRIVLYDSPNQGAGRVVAGPANLSLDEQVDILNAVIDATSFEEPVTVCSASWGGVVALAYAAAYPRRLRSLILASVATKANQRMVDMITKGLAMPVKDRSVVAQTLIDNLGKELPEAFKNRIVSQFQRMDPGAFRAFFEHGSNVISARRLDVVVDVAKIQCKAILLYGENDAILDLEDVRTLASQIPRSEVRVIKDVGHFLHLEKEELLDVYDELLSSLAPQPS